ncbi:MAG TPA: hypothetical protein VIU61_04785 [Kofleriaceae bacterium]
MGDPVAPTPAPPPQSMTAVAPAPAPESEGMTLRNGFSVSLGQEFGTSNLMNEFSGQLYGIDWRIGAQINKALGIYLDSHLSFGSVKVNSVTGSTGNFAAAAIGEYTLPMRLFFGGGAGYGILNNPSGPLVAARAGYYPFEASSTGKSRRWNIALDMRLYFVKEGPESVTMKHIAVTLGYDRF